MQKQLSDIALKLSEEEYRSSKEYHYSTLATYERGGFNGLSTLFDMKFSPSLLFGSCVDTLLTDGEEAYNKAYMIAEFPKISTAEETIVKSLFSAYSDIYDSLYKISDDLILNVSNMQEYQMRWRPETRAKVIKEKCGDYYNLLYLAKDKQIISTELNDKVQNTVTILKESPATSWYFAPNSPFDSVQRYYQLKFKFTHNNIGFMCMADLIVVDYDKKIIYPCDLKTSSHKEWDFYKSFIDWNYQIQARSYWRNIRANMDADNYFKDFELANYRFIVCNGESLEPLVWEFTDTKELGTLTYGKNNQIVCRDPYEIAEELNYYLSTGASVPLKIQKEGTNNIIEWLNKY